MSDKSKELYPDIINIPELEKILAQLIDLYKFCVEHKELLTHATSVLQIIKAICGPTIILRDNKGMQVSDRR